MSRIKFIENQEFLRKIVDRMRRNLGTPKSLIGNAKMTKDGFFRVRQATIIYAKSLGLDYSCITIKHDMEAKSVSAGIVQHKNDPIVRYEYFLDYIEFELVIT